MTEPADAVRSSSFGQGHRLSAADRLGIWLSGRRVRREVGSFAGKTVGDFGSGYEARLARAIAAEAAAVTASDVALAPDLADMARIRAVEGELPGILSTFADASFDVVLCVSVLEHLWHPDVALAEFRRLLKPGGVCVVNVPSWRGKRLLELSAFRLGLSPAAEMNDHKWYFDPRDLWPLLVRAGFRPEDIRCRRHKFGLNTFATCRAPR